MKIGDADPRGVRDHCFTISEKALAIGGGVLEAILSAPQLTGFLQAERR
jgi:xanthine dehydrogenase accessory factor